jgi:cell division protein FtsL
MSNRLLTIALAVLAVVFAVGFAYEHSRTTRLEGDVSEARDKISALGTELVNLRPAEQGVKSDTARLSLLRRAERPATRIDIDNLASRIDILEGALRSLRTAGK